MRYTTVALRPETKVRLEALRAALGLRSMDEAVAAAVDHLDVARTAAEVRRLSQRGSQARKPSIIDELEKASVGLDDSIRAVRKGMRKRFG